MTVLVQCRMSEYIYIEASPCRECAEKRNDSCFNDRYESYEVTAK